MTDYRLPLDKTLALVERTSVAGTHLCCIDGIWSASVVTSSGAGRMASARTLLAALRKLLSALREHPKQPARPKAKRGGK